MNKSVVIGIAIVIIIAIIGVAYSISSSEKNEEKIPGVEDVILDEILDVQEEIASEETVQQGREISVEFSETIGIKTQ